VGANMVAQKACFSIKACSFHQVYDGTVLAV
jgi:hypothetical protein